MSLLKRNACAAVQDKQSVLGCPDRDAAPIARTPLQAEGLLPKRAVRSGSLTSK